MSEAIGEFVGFDGLAKLAPQWADLCARAAPNPFAEPSFLLPLLAYEQPKRLVFVLARSGGRLIGFAALIAPPLGLARVWVSPYAALPAMAFDREAAAPAIAAIAALLGAKTRLTGIVWPFVEAGSGFDLALRAAGLPLICAGRIRRSALRLAGAAAFETGLDAKRRTKWARQARKLAARGRLEGKPESPEAFFAIERAGWKGARRSALADDPARLAFARAALQAFEASGRLDALTLRLDGAAIAAGLVLIAGERAFYWKTAYDEAYAEASPGVQLTLAHSRRLADTPGLTLADSCALEDHPMIGRVWGDWLAFAHWGMALDAANVRPLAIWLAWARARAGARERLKQWVHAMRRRPR